MPYKTEYSTSEYRRGNMYTFMAKVPEIGLVIMEDNTGFGDCSSRNFVVLGVYKNKRKEVNKAEIARVHSWDKNTKTLNYIDNERYMIVQSYAKTGEWKFQGDKFIGSNSCNLLYYFRFGDIEVERAAIDK
jgi:hypothetical protein